MVGYVPLDGEARHAGLLSEDVSANALDDGLGRWLGVELGGVIFVVDVVADANKLAVVVGAGQKDDGDTEDVAIGDDLGVWRVGLEEELVDADGDGADEEGVELLIVLVAAGRGMVSIRVALHGARGEARAGERSLRGGRADVGELPLEIWDALAGVHGMTGDA